MRTFWSARSKCQESCGEIATFHTISDWKAILNIRKQSKLFEQNVIDIMVQEHSPSNELEQKSNFDAVFPDLTANATIWMGVVNPKARKCDEFNSCSEHIYHLPNFTRVDENSTEVDEIHLENFQTVIFETDEDGKKYLKSEDSYQKHFFICQKNKSGNSLKTELEHLNICQPNFSMQGSCGW